jgi:hypothetical protein
MFRIRLAATIAAVALCALPTSAAAHSHRDRAHHQAGRHRVAHHRTNPKPGSDSGTGFGRLSRAADLCARAAAGDLPTPLAGSESAVQAACTSLKSALTQATTNFQDAVAPLKQQASDAVTAAKTACEQAWSSGDPTGCEQALAQLRSTLEGFRAQLTTAAGAFRSAVNDARTAFWSAIHSLVGGAGVTPDQPTSQTPPLPTLPLD